MKALVIAAAPRYSTTDQIADTVACTLKQHGVNATYAHIDDVESMDSFNSVIIGCPVDSPEWTEQVHQLICSHRGLTDCKVWLFSPDGAGGASLRRELLATANLKHRTGAVEHRFFPEYARPEGLDFTDSTVLNHVLLDGMSRSNPIHRWAAGIARTLRSESAPVVDWQLTL